jgi:hypothetical protein
MAKKNLLLMILLSALFAIIIAIGLDVANANQLTANRDLNVAGSACRTASLNNESLAS